MAPQDELAALYLRRIEALRSAPPADNWDGSIALDSK
jgi:hypothetical protein